MLHCHLPETYIDVVKAHHAQRGTEEEQNPLAKALSGWLFPASLFEPSHNVREDSDSCDNVSVETERTVEDDWDDDLEEQDDDWDDTYSIGSDDEESYSVGQIGAGWQSPLFSSEDYNDDEEGHFYFNPTPDDFPRPRQSVMLRVEVECVEPEEEIKKVVPQAPDVWNALGAGIMQNLDKFRTFTDSAINDICRKAEEARQKLSEQDIFTNKSRESLPIETKGTRPQSQSPTKKYTAKASPVNVASAENGTRRKSSRSKVTIKRSQPHDNLSRFFTPSTGRPRRAQNALARTSSGQLDKYSYGKQDAFSLMMTTTSSNGRTKASTRKSKSSSGQRKPSKASRTKPSHRRTMSTRLHPSALSQNDFPWY